MNNTNRIYNISIPECLSIYGGFSSYLSNISAPKVEYIGSNAFIYCSNLTSLEFPNCEYVGSTAFNRCSNLSYLSLPKCTYLDYGALADNPNLSNLYLPEVEYIGQYTLPTLPITSYNFSKLTTMGTGNINSSVTYLSIPNISSFRSNYKYGNTSWGLSFLNIENCESVDVNAMISCTTLEEVVLTNVKNIGSQDQ